MKVMRGFLVIVCGLAVAAVPTAAAAADTISVVQVITIHARILPARYIIVNSAGDITEIDSNTSDAVLPSVWVGGTNQPANQRPLTPVLQREYDHIMSGVAHPGPGVLYRRTAPTVLQKAATISSLLRAPNGHL